MTDREKLIELLHADVCEGKECPKCPYSRNDDLCIAILARKMADYMIANGVTVQRWIPVTERLPDNSEYDWVLAQVVEDNGYMHLPKVMEYRRAMNDWYEESYGWLSQHNGMFRVTHWMPMPEPPKEGT